MPQQPRGCPDKADAAAACRGPHGRAAGCASEPQPLGDPCWSSLFLKDCTPRYRRVLEKLLMSCNPEGSRGIKDHAPWEGPPLEQGKVARRKEQQRSSIMPASPIHHPPVPLSTGGEGRRMETEAEPGKKGDQDSVFSLL